MALWSVDNSRLPNKNVETRSEHLKILLNSDFVQTWCMFRLEMEMSESGLRQVWLLSYLTEAGMA